MLFYVKIDIKKLLGTEVMISQEILLLQSNSNCISCYTYLSWISTISNFSRVFIYTVYMYIFCDFLWFFDIVSMKDKTLYEFKMDTFNSCCVISA